MEASFFTAVFLPIALAIIMLGMGLSLVPDDFLRVAKYPKAVAVALISQLIILPAIAFVIAKVIPMPNYITVGLLILALCPGGATSNLITYFAQGDVALSVTLTALSSTITVFTIPIASNIALQYFIGTTAAIALPISTTMLQIFAITLLPIGLGMSIKQRFPEFAFRLEKVTSKIAIAFLILIISGLIIREWSRLPGFIAQVGIAVVLLNISAMMVGFYISKLFNLSIPQQICIAIEVGFQNGTLAITITAGLLNNPDMAIPAAIYSLFMYITGFLIIYYGRRDISVKVS
ncbi:MAG: bile acid:sodium symporter family protein [Richelia sp. RM2_1_2]|nr:bile acid:sodium symporter family protein [Richelia sp. SM1_7_0]NJN08783.1 bile acid:sodium symporter family protein [Richelia sp. RM1_1_1]NJO27446.1 bile acid:sodium symporter family protein [Richelia sp. SL_2_1]NJO58626.1 bile acid:sodium symporter family protein [Richelia sp. RM2_1_2]NJS16426.1 bile acid:sodium symporter family protein [Nostocaceae cyanobacterium CSU_2_110]